MTTIYLPFPTNVLGFIGSALDRRLFELGKRCATLFSISLPPFGVMDSRTGQMSGRHHLYLRCVGAKMWSRVRATSWQRIYRPDRLGQPARCYLGTPVGFLVELPSGELPRYSRIQSGLGKSGDDANDGVWGRIATSDAYSIVEGPAGQKSQG